MKFRNEEFRTTHSLALNRLCVYLRTSYALRADRHRRQLDTMTSHALLSLTVEITKGKSARLVRQHLAKVSRGYFLERIGSL